MGKLRLDDLMLERGMVDSRLQAQKLIMAGQVRVNREIELKPSTIFLSDVQVEIEKPPRFVSRGGEKLEGALIAFEKVDLSGIVCVDVGSSTGGFTDCLLQHGARKVYAVDVGYGILHWKLRNDERVVVMEETNARFVTGFPDKIDLVTVDASFISLRVLLPVIFGWLEGTAEVVALIKPQFEAGRKIVARGSGVVRSPEVHRQVLREMLEFSAESGFSVLGLVRSSLVGPKGNAEFLLHLGLPGRTSIDYEKAIQQVIETSAGAPEPDPGD